MYQKPKVTLNIQEPEMRDLALLKSTTGLSLNDVASIGTRRVMEEFNQTGEVTIMAKPDRKQILASPDFVEMSFLSHCLSDPQFATERMIDANVAATAFETTFGKAVAHAIETLNSNGWDIEHEGIRRYLSERSLSAEDAEKALKELDRCDPSKLHEALREELETLWDRRFPVKQLEVV